MADGLPPFALDDELRSLLDELHEATQAAGAAIESDPQAWLENAARAAEIHEKLAERFGWREAAPDA